MRTLEQVIAGTKSAAPAVQEPGASIVPASRSGTRTILWWLLAAVVLVFTVVPSLRAALDVPAWQHEVDLEVYRSAGQSVLIGRPVYGYLTPAPNLLPFTYPPPAALLAVPFAMMAVAVAQNVWVALQLALIALICAIAGRPILRRFRGAWPVALAALIGAACATMPIADGLFFGQVGTLLVGLCLVDVALSREADTSPTGRDATAGLGGRWRRWRPGVLVGLATSLKLVPGLFVIHLLFAGRRRMAWSAAVSAVAATLVAFLVIPQDSWDYWTGAVFDTSRIGAVASTYNVSLNGAAQRLGPHTTVGRLGWGAVTLGIAVWGLWIARRASKAGLQVTAVGVIGLLSVLLSPLSWLHHLVWIIPALLALLGDGRDWRRVVLAALGYVVHLDYFQLPWKGARDLYNPAVPHLLARIEQSSYTITAVLLILALDLLVVRAVPRGVNAREAADL